MLSDSGRVMTLVAFIVNRAIRAAVIVRADAVVVDPYAEYDGRTNGKNKRSRQQERGELKKTGNHIQCIMH